MLHSCEKLHKRCGFKYALNHNCLGFNPQTKLIYFLRLNEEFVFKSISGFSFILSVGILCGWVKRSCACICTCAHKATLGTSRSKLRWWSMTLRMAHTISWTSTLLQCCVWWHSIKRLKDTRSKVAKHYINLLSSENIGVSPCKIQRQLFNYEKRIPKDIIYRLPPLKQLSFSWRFADIFLPAHCCFFHFMTVTVITELFMVPYIDLGALHSFVLLFLIVHMEMTWIVSLK